MSLLFSRICSLALTFCVLLPRHHLMPPLLFHPPIHSIQTPHIPSLRHKIESLDAPLAHSRHVFSTPTVPIPVVAKPHTVIGSTIPQSLRAHTAASPHQRVAKPCVSLPLPESLTLSSNRNRGGNWSDKPLPCRSTAHSKRASERALGIGSCSSKPTPSRLIQGGRTVRGKAGPGPGFCSRTCNCSQTSVL